MPNGLRQLKKKKLKKRKLKSKIRTISQYKPHNTSIIQKPNKGMHKKNGTMKVYKGQPEKKIIQPNIKIIRVNPLPPYAVQFWRQMPQVALVSEIYHQD